VKTKICTSLLVALALTVGAIGCGGGGEADPLPKKAFVSQANEICVQGTKDREAAMSEAAKDTDSDGESEAQVTDAAVETTEDMVGELDDLGVPKGDAKQVEAIIADFEKGIETVEADPEKGLGSAAFEKANEAAIGYGLTDCAI
jgi:hypothetical protein